MHPDHGPLTNEQNAHFPRERNRLFTLIEIEGLKVFLGHFTPGPCSFYNRIRAKLTGAGGVRTPPEVRTDRELQDFSASMSHNVPKCPTLSGLDPVSACKLKASKDLTQCPTPLPRGAQLAPNSLPDQSLQQCPTLVARDSSPKAGYPKRLR